MAVTGKPLFCIANLQSVHLKAYFTLGQLANIRLDDRVRVVANFGGGNTREYQATVCHISPKAEFTPKNIVTDNERENLVYAVKIAVDNDGYIKMGMYGEVYLN